MLPARAEVLRASWKTASAGAPSVQFEGFPPAAAWPPEVSSLPSVPEESPRATCSQRLAKVRAHGAAFTAQTESPCSDPAAKLYEVN